MVQGQKLKIDMIMDWMNKSDYYQILNVSREANSAQIKVAYFKLSRQYHPDKFFTLPDETTKQKINDVFKRLNEAYAILRKPTKRKRYDELAFGPDRLQHLRYSPGDEDRGGPANPEDHAKTPNGKKYLKLALSAQVKKDWKTVEQNCNFALGFEPDNDYIKKLLQKSRDEFKKTPKDNPFAIK